MDSDDVIKVVDKLEEITEALKPGAEQVWAVYMKQAALAGWTALFETFASILVLYGCWKLYRHGEELGPHEGDGHFGVSAAAAIIALVLLWCFFETAVTGLVNPEYLAIRKLLQ